MGRQGSFLRFSPSDGSSGGGRSAGIGSSGSSCGNRSPEEVEDGGGETERSGNGNREPNNLKQTRY